MIIAATAAIITLLSGCTAPSEPDAEVPLESLTPFVGANGLISSIAPESFTPSSVSATALGIRFDQLVGREPLPLDDDDWRGLWLQDTDEATWKTHYICDALGASRATAVIPRAEQQEVIDLARGDIAAFSSELKKNATAQIGSLSGIVAMSTIWCLEGEDVLRGFGTSQLLTAAVDNAGLALQWRDALTKIRGRTVDGVVRDTAWKSRFATEMSEEQCDDRSAIEAASLLILSGGNTSNTAQLERCAIDGADSSDAQVLVALARLAHELPSISESLSELLTAASVRNDSGAYGPRPVVSGTIQGTVLGLRLLRARSQKLVDYQREELMAVLDSMAVPDSPDAASLMQACILLGLDCESRIDAGLSILGGMAVSVPSDIRSLEPVLSPLATVASVRREEVTGILDGISNKIDDPCATKQLATFISALESDQWPAELSASELSDDLIHSVKQQDLSTYCNLSWLTTFAPLKQTSNRAVSDLPSREGYPLMGGNYAPLSVIVTLEELGAK